MDDLGKFDPQWLIELGKFASSLPDLGPVRDGDGTWMDGAVAIHDGDDKKLADVIWDHEAEAWQVKFYGKSSAA